MTKGPLPVQQKIVGLKRTYRHASIKLQSQENFPICCERRDLILILKCISVKVLISLLFF